jgi:signal peptidase I
VDTATSTIGALATTVVRWSGRLAGWALAAAVLLTVTVVMVLPRATSGFAMTVLTGSMSPEIPVGSVVLVRPVDAETLHVGDVATYLP